MVAHIVPCLSCLFNSSAEVFVSCPLKREKIILLHEPCIFVQAVCHHQEHGIKKNQDQQQYQTDHDISLQDPTGIQRISIGWHHEQIQGNEDQRQDPEDVPGLCEIFICHHGPRSMGRRIPGCQKEKQADPIIKNSSSDLKP